jgi:hypothetical protein
MCAQDSCSYRIGEIRKSHPQYREKAVMWRVFSMLPLCGSLAGGRMFRWFALTFQWIWVPAALSPATSTSSCVATIYLPARGDTREFICIEPLTAIISGVNLVRQDKYSDLQTVASGAKWSEGFWIRATGL